MRLQQLQERHRGNREPKSTSPFLLNHDSLRCYNHTHLWKTDLLSDVSISQLSVYQSRVVFVGVFSPRQPGLGVLATVRVGEQQEVDFVLVEQPRRVGINAVIGDEVFGEGAVPEVIDVAGLLLEE